MDKTQQNLDKETTMVFAFGLYTFPDSLWHCVCHTV